MSKTITIDGTDRTTIVRLAGQLWSESAERGSVGVGGFDLSDEGGSVSVPPLKPITVDESAAGTARMFTGYIADPALSRGPYRVGSDRAWDVDVLDVNTLLDDRLLFVNADRPEETDYARVTWLLSTAAMTGITAGVVPNTNTVTMDAIDYRGANPRRVLDECTEMSGKNYFLYRYGSGPLLYYDLESGTSLSSSARFSSVAADVDNAVTWGAAVVSHKKETGHVYSRLRMTYANGSVWVTNASTASTYRQREISFTDKSIKTKAKAVTKATKYLAAAAVPTERFTLLVKLPAANVNDIRAGQRAEVKIPHLGISAFTFYRCVSRTVEPAKGRSSVSDVLYDVRLDFAANAFPTRFREQHTDDSRVGTGGGGGEVGGDGDISGAGCDDCNTPYNPTGADGNKGFVAWDDFNRTVAPNSWGTGSHGFVYASGLGNATHGVDGSAGYIESIVTPAGVSPRHHADVPGWEPFDPAPDNSTNPWATGIFTMRLRWKVSRLTTADKEFTMMPQATNSNDVGVVFSGSAASLRMRYLKAGAGSSTEVTAAVAIAADTWYILEWDRRGDLSRERVYADGTVPPDWQLSVAAPLSWPVANYVVGGTLDTPSWAYWDFSALVGDGSTPAQRMSFDYLAFASAGSPRPGHQVLSETVDTVAGATTYRARTGYKPGTLRVWIDGIDVTTEVTESNPATGEYLLGFTPEDDETIKVDYVASGRVITNETIAGGDGTETIFRTRYPYQSGSLTGYVDDVDTALTETSPTLGTFTFTAAPAADTVITADYTKR